MDAKEEIRSRLAIEDVIGEYVPLKRAGRSFKGLSPFSQEKTASFFVSPDKQIWHDFSSNRGGDVFSFVMEVEGLDFRQTLELLARKAGVDLSLYQTSGNQNLTKKKQRLLTLLDSAATFYQRILFKSPEAIEYVSKKRHLSRDIVHTFRVGYAPDASDSLQQFLLSRQFTKTEIREAGLIGSSGRYDMFRDRIMVPLMDGSGQVIGFTARLLSDTKKAPKYINTPQTLVYDKSRHVFGLSQAKEAIRTNDYAVIVEGNLDVISAHQAGTTQVVATAGTALTEFHLKALSRLTHHIRLCFDGDRAGIAAAERAVPIAQRVGVELSIVSLPDEYKDPDEAIQADVGIWTKAIGQHMPAIDWLFIQYEKRYDLTTASGKRQFSTEAMTILRSLRDTVEQEHYLQKLSEITGASIDALKQKLAQDPLEEKRYKQSVAPAPQKADHDPDVLQDYLLGLALYDSSVHDTLRRLGPEDVAGEQRQAVLSHLLNHLGEATPEKLPRDLHEYETYVKIVMFKAETRYEAYDANQRIFEAANLVRRVQEEKATQKKLLLDQALSDAEARHDDERAQALRAELAALIKEKKRAR